MRLPIILTGLLIRSVLAVFPDEAYEIDYHHALLGLPKGDSSFFHQPNANSKASLIYTLSEKSVIGAVNPKDGALVWRQSLPSAVNSSAALLRTGDDQDVVVSATDSEVAAWAASDGRLIWSYTFRQEGLIKDVALLELVDGASSTGVKDVLVLFQGSFPIVQRLDGATGAIKWQYGDSRYGMEL
jgi:outer membrane protein assembly factor BamB